MNHKFKSIKKLLILLFSISILFSSCDKKSDGIDLNPTPEFKPTVVKTEIMTKSVVIEEYTGVRCPFCPDGAAVLQEILDDNPERAFGVACHPENGNYNTPYGTDEDLRRTFLIAFWTSAFAGYIAMPTAMISRRVWSNGNRSQSRSNWAGYANIIMSDTSPVNIGVTSAIVGDTLIVNVEIYYTDSVTNGNALYCYLTESGIITQQAGATGPYEHHRVFRESFSGQWGDELLVDKRPGTFIRYTYKYLYTASNYDMAECQILVFIRDMDNEEIITGNSAPVGASTPGPNS